MSIALVRPPTRLSLMLTQRQALIWMALRVLSSDVMLSSRQMGVFICDCSVAWSMRSSWASGCSSMARLNWSKDLSRSISLSE